MKKLSLLLVPLVLSGCQMPPKPEVHSPEPKPLPIEERGIDELCDIRTQHHVSPNHEMKVLNFDLVVTKVNQHTQKVYAHSLSRAERDMKMKGSQFYEPHYDVRAAVFRTPNHIELKTGDLINLTGVVESSRLGTSCTFNISDNYPVKVVKKGVFEYVPKD